MEGKCTEIALNVYQLGKNISNISCIPKAVWVLMCQKRVKWTSRKYFSYAEFLNTLK